MRTIHNYIPDKYGRMNKSGRRNKSIRRLVRLCICFIITAVYLMQPLTAVAAESTSSDSNTTDENNTNAAEQRGGELHAFYPSNAVFSEQMQKYIDDLDSISFAWSRIEAEDPENLNTVKGKNGNYSFYYPADFLQPIEYAKSMGKSIQLNVYMNGGDCTVLLPYADQRSAILQAIVNAMQTDITQGEGIYYDGVVIDFEGLRNTDANGAPILYNGNQISSYYMQFLTELKAQLDSLGKKLYVAVNPALYFDGYNYSDILDVTDRVIIMAHDYEPMEKLQKSQVQQYTDYDTLKPINSLAPIQQVRQALNDIQNAASDPSLLSKVWLQICFDSAQWKFDLSSVKSWEQLSDTALSKEGRSIPLYRLIKARVDNTDGYGQNISYGYNNELQSPYLQYYNSSDQTWNVIIYEDSTSISAKIELVKAYKLGGISLWSLANLPDYNDSAGQKFHLDGWATIISEMDSYDTLPSESSEYVSFTDGAVEQAIREKLGKPSGNISVWEMQSIYRLKLSEGVKSLENLKMLTNLEYLDARQLDLQDITAIGSLTKLRVLYLQRNLITDISALKKLTSLEVLSLNGNQIVSISALSSLKNLREVYLRENKIKSITALNKLTKLERLEGGVNSIQNIDSLKNLKNLGYLALDNNQINDITGIKALTNLANLDLSNNKITSIKTLKNLTGLETLYLQRNYISDISAISALKKLKVLSLNGNKISSLKPLAKLSSLEKLYLKDNIIKSIASLKGLVNLKELYLGGNNISDYSPVKTAYSKNGFLCDFMIN
ncbi:MAG TPA: leucine-rich repeat domain-containing protein [Mobilitalea sp.]|nr:leucine-rich repeat domain-containing protein [Mobilitalea sp.]